MKQGFAARFLSLSASGHDTFACRGNQNELFLQRFIGDIIVKRITIIFTAFVMLALNAHAQRANIAEVKKDISGLTMTVDSYNKAFKKLEPALANDETRNRAETWALANRIKIELYDKYMDNRRVGKKIDAKLMGHALLDGYDYSLIALKLDTVYILDNKGEKILDKKSKRPRVRTKYSKDIANRMLDHHDDFRLVGSELYNVKDWNSGISSSKFINEVIFIALNIVPVYEICYLADVLVFNSIEFWTGDNPIAKNVGKTQQVMGSDGKMYAVTNLKDGYEIKNDLGEIVEFKYDKKERVWSVNTENGTVKLLKVKDNNTAELYLQNGKSMDITLDAQGVYAARMAVNGCLFFANR